MPFQKIQWLFPIAVALHNAEEAISMPGWVAAHSGQIPFHRSVHPEPFRIWGGLLALTLAAFVVTFFSARRGKESVWAYLSFGFAVAMLANVLVPHVLATLVFGGYTPGVATAVLVNLPVMSILLFRAVREGWVTGTKAVVYAVLVPLGLVVGIVALFSAP